MAQWWYLQNGEKQGPVDEADIRAAMAQGTLGPMDMVWTQGMSDWQQVGQRPEFSAGQPAGLNPMLSPGQYLKPHRGTVVLVLGILGLVFCFICGIIAWVMGNNDLREMDEGVMDPAGRDVTNAGRVCGMISTILGICSFIFVILYFIAMFSFMSNNYR
ncbi:MAG TPA: DUF4339 domain-containing protein [Phycisphaerae bacterium]|nr:DUF4339 domain-containing protein [Phycisphaerae bacterium]